MGRHGGGSRSGGSSRSSSSRSRGGSRSGGGGDSFRTSTEPFKGGYNRSYYDSRGKFHSYYTEDRSFGTKSGFTISILFTLCFVTLHMFAMMSGFLFNSIEFGKKVSGDANRLFVEDTVNILTDRQEENIIELFENVYQESGMPITLYTDDYEWKEHYTSLEVYSEELYYTLGSDEQSMIIVFTVDTKSGFYDWEYDMYCGDDTVSCMSDDVFDDLLSNFHKAMARQNLAFALEHAWNSVMDDLCRTRINFGMIWVVPILIAFYSVFYITIWWGAKQQIDACRYFKKNPDKLSMYPLGLYNKCPNCGATNTEERDVCSYCDSPLSHF